ncbi:MAG: preprotein translocase subunit SecE [candidate division Zixibacteria bacterium SM23_73_2]|nr:MAG: preprotein translocase subunit SecE [candidate division Zixibacteria bacterium SM23_73_2]
MFEKIKRFLKEVKVELTKVTWLSKRELLGSTVIVIILSFILAIFIGVVDKLLSMIMSFILS